ncbi:MAG: threonine ammonia-lyase [Solirubrobacterales bacterium]
MSEEVSLESIRAARPVVAEQARPTPLIESRFLSRTTGGTIALKAENLQRTGSFKLRGALNKIASLEPTPSGVVTASAGNHGQSLAYAARANGISATVFMPERASLGKIAATKESGAEVVLEGDSLTPCVEAATARAEAEGLAFVHPYDDPAVIAGQGTLGLELVEEAPDLARVVVPLGGGGLAAGVATAVKGSLDGVEMIGVQAEMRDATTLADGIAVKRPGKLTGPLLERLVDEIVAVGEHEIAEAIVMLLERTKLVVEGAGAVGVAALRGGAIEPAAMGTTAVILSGGNIDTGILADVARRHETATGRRLRLFTTIPDEPGSLAALLTCLGEGGANLIDVAHVREGVGLEVGDTGVELVMETRGDEHARRLLALVEERGYSARVLS